MLVIEKKVGKPATAAWVRNDLTALQKAVGGYIEVVEAIEGCMIICDEDGRLKKKPFNCRILGHDFCGDILIVGTEFTSLKPAAIKFWLEKFNGNSKEEAKFEWKR